MRAHQKSQVSARILAASLVLGCRSSPADETDTSRVVTLTLEPDASTVSAAWFRVSAIGYKDRSGDRGDFNAELAARLRMFSGEEQGSSLHVRVDPGVRYADVHDSLYTAVKVGFGNWLFVVGREQHQIQVGFPTVEVVDNVLMYTHHYRGCWNLIIAIDPSHAEIAAMKMPAITVEPGVPVLGPAPDGPQPSTPIVHETIGVGWGANGPNLDDADAWIRAHKHALCPNISIVPKSVTPWRYIEPALVFVDARGHRPILGLPR